MKKQTKRQAQIQTAEQVVTEVVAQIVESAEKRVATEEVQPRRTKMVEFRCQAEIMEFSTEKAQLLAFESTTGEEVKCWLAKSLTYFVADADEPHTMICRLPAWLYFRKGLNNFFPILRWSQATA